MLVLETAGYQLISSYRSMWLTETDLCKRLQDDTSRYMIELWPKNTNAVDVVSKAVHQRMHRDNSAIFPTGFFETQNLAVPNISDSIQQWGQFGFGQPAVDSLIRIPHRRLIPGIHRWDFPAGVVEPVETSTMVCLRTMMDCQNGVQTLRDGMCPLTWLPD